MKILLVDDNARHRRAGEQQLKALGHEVVALSGYSDVPERVRTESFDAALLDLLMPAEPMMLGDKARAKHVGEEMGIGFALLLTLAGHVKLIAVATDTNHHDHPMSALVDWFYHKDLVVNGSRALIMHAPMLDGGIKDWATVLERLTTPQQ
jgi:CheY-like chemotaxis protein